MPSVARRITPLSRWLVVSVLCCIGQHRLMAAPYELRVYSDDIPAANESEIEWLSSVARPAINTPIPDGRVTQTLIEYGYGMGNGWVLGLGLPMSHADGHSQVNGFKTEVQYVAQHNAQQGWYWGVRSDVGRTSSPYEPQGRYSVGINPIVGYHWLRWHAVLNPSVEIPLSGSNQQTQFQPAFKIAHSITSTRQWGVEYFSNWGAASSIRPAHPRDETLYAVWDEQRPRSRWSFGLGQPLRPTGGSVDKWVFKIGANMDID